MSVRIEFPCPDDSNKEWSPLTSVSPRPIPFSRFRWTVRGDSGQDLAEYAILTALIVLVVIGVLSLVGDRIAAFYESVVGVLPFNG